MKRTIKNYSGFTINNSGLLNSFIKVVFCMVVLSVLLSVISVKAQASTKPRSSAVSSVSPANTPRSHPSPVAHKSTAATTSLRKSPSHTSTATSESSSTETIVIAQTSNIPLPGRSNKTSTDPPSSATPASSRKIYDKTQTTAAKSSKTASTTPSTSSSTTTLTSAATTRVTTKPISMLRLTTPITKLSHHATTHVSAKATSIVATSPKNTSPASGPPQTVSSANEVTTVVTNGRSDTSSATTSPRQTHAATSVSPTATNQSTASTAKLSTRPVTMGNSSYSDTMKPNTASADSSISPTKTIAGTSVTDNSTQVPSNQTNTTTIPPPVTHKQQNGTGMANTNPVTITNTSLPSPSTATLHSSTQSRISSNQGEINMTSPAASMSENKTVADATTHTISGATINTVSNATMRSPTNNNNKTNKVIDATEKPITTAASNTFNNVSTYTISSTPKSTNTQVVANITTNTSTYSTTKTVSNAITNIINKTTLKPTTDATPNTDNFATTSYFPSSKTTNNATIEINTATTITGSKLTTKSIAASTTNRFANTKTNANIGTTTRKAGTDIITTINTITGAILNNHTSSSTVSSVITTVGAQKTTINASATVNVTGMTLTTAGSRQQTNISSVGGSSSFKPTAGITDHSTQPASPNKTASTASVTTATHSRASPSLANATKSTISFSTKSASTLLNPSPSSDSSKATDQPSTSSTTRATTTIDPCATLVCQNGGTCSSNGSGASCTCSAGYTGLNCSVDIDDCSGAPCRHGATCTDLVNSFNCSCVSGYTGNTCETDIDECSSNPCQYKGNCTNLVNGFNCTCAPGYTGDTCETDINECQSNPCKHGNCTDLVNGYKCTCFAGYTGNQCQMDINECGSSPCKNGGQCNNLVNGFNCTCVAGFNGTLCQNNIDDCVNSKCQNGATCRDGVNNYTCTCLQGWEGPYCSKDVDECNTKKHNCSKFADCINNNGSYSCNCHSGFSGDGFTCVDIDECYNSSLNGCVNGTCFNLYGSYACVCNDGWEGAHCSKDIDECKKSNACPVNSNCTNLKGSYSCSCKEGYREEDDKCIYKVLYEIPTDKWQTIKSIHEDDGIRRVNLDQPILYFSKLYFVVYVSANGYVSLGKRYNARIPPKSSDSWPLDPPIIAPLWADIDPSLNDSGVYISQLRSDHNSENLKTLNAAIDFEPTFALMVTWKNAPPYPAVETLNSEAGNFQMVIATNGSQTSIIFNYDRTKFKWKTAPGRHVSMGYFDYADKKAFLQFTDANFLLAISGRNKRVPEGRWVYNVAGSSDPTINNGARCRNIALRKSIQEKVWEQSRGFEPCPCTLAQAWRDRRFRPAGRENNVHKFRSTFAFGLLAKRRLCNYNDNGILLRGYPNGGYLDVHLNGITMQDVYEDCCRDTKLCDLFYFMNPSDTCSNYRPPSWAFGWGDPHITTLDGTEYTFNGRGEYVFARTSTDYGSLEVQVRTELVSNTSNDSTIFVGIAAKEFSVPDFGDVIEILLNRTTRTVDVLLNHIYNTTYKAGDGIEIEGKNFWLYNKSGELVLAFPSGFSLQIAVSDILSIVANAAPNGDSLANMKGLLGNNDGDKTNDFVARNGTLFDVSSSEEQLWSFGTSWMLENRNTSLFSYSGALDFAYFNNPMIKPKSFINDISNITAFLSENCGVTVTAAEVNDTCKGNKACETDVALTCAKTFGKRTKQVQTINTKNAKVSGNQPPVIDGPAEFLVHAIHGQAKSSFIKVEDDSDQLADITVENNTSMYASFKKLNDTTYELQWNNTVLYSTDPAPYFKLVATDSMNATTEYWPKLYYCECTRLGECTFSLGSVQNGTANKFVKLSCECDSGWTGNRCDTEIDLCSENPCYNETSCAVVDGKPKCGPCPDGLTGNGTKCYDINECETGEAKCSQDCENKQGSYRCKCRPGYKFGNDNSSCIDIDECQNVQNKCTSAANEICSNTEGSYECKCRPGFVNESNSCIEALSQFVGVLSYRMERHEQDVSAILRTFLWNIFNSSNLTLISIEIMPVQEIHRTYRMVHLPIPRTTRYILNSNKQMDSQEATRLWNKYKQSQVCGVETCRDMVNGVALSVYTKASKIYDDSDNMLCEVERSRCDPVSTRCFSVSGRMYCQCKAGFTKLDYYLDRCDDINECASSNPCVGGTCVNTPGNFTCYCPAGYSFISGACTDLCNPSPCQNGGTCIHGQEENEYICKCDGKWAGQKCERENAEASRLQTTLIAVGASIGGVCFLLLVTLFGVCRRSRKRYESYLNRRAMSSINGYEGSKLQFYDAPYDDDMSGPSTFTIPRPQVKKSQYEMQENGSGSELGLIEDDGAAKFDDPSKPKGEAKKETEEGEGNQSFLHSEGSLKDERKRSKNPYEYF